LGGVEFGLGAKPLEDLVREKVFRCSHCHDE
jgi:hypothetical protein